MMTSPWRTTWFSAICFLFAIGARAEINVVDDTGTSVHLNAAAQRIVSLAPDITETLFAIGAGAQIVGAVEFSNSPVAAQRLPRIGSYVQLDLEKIMSLHPDLAIAWADGNSGAQINKLRALGIPVFVARPQHVHDIPRLMEKYGELTQAHAASIAAAQVRSDWQALQKRYAHRPPVRVFYELWKVPLLTVGGEQIISQVISLCGGINIFAHLRTQIPAISIEAVLAANPQVIIASGMDAERPEWLDSWQRWKSMDAAAQGHLFFIPPDILQRPTPRLLEGAERMCHFLELARRR